MLSRISTNSTKKTNATAKESARDPLVPSISSAFSRSNIFAMTLGSTNFLTNRPTRSDRIPMIAMHARVPAENPMMSASNPKSENGPSPGTASLMEGPLMGGLINAPQYFVRNHTSPRD